MKIVSNNFYSIENSLFLVLSLELGSIVVASEGNPISFFVDNSAVGNKLKVTTRTHIFEYDIVQDANDMQQVYNLKMQPSGLISSISTSVVESGIDLHTNISFSSSTVFNDYDLWFYTQEFKILIPNYAAVDKIEIIFSDNLKPFALNITALQSTNELLILTDPTPTVNLSSDGEIQFRVFTNENEYLTTPVVITPGDESLSECRVSGTFFSGNSIIDEDQD